MIKNTINEIYYQIVCFENEIFTISGHKCEDT